VAVALATATIAQGDDRHDIAVPVGTTIAGLTAMLGLNTRTSVMTLADGRPAAPGSVIGGDLPAGVLLAVTESRASRSASQASKARTGGHRTARVAIGTAGFAIAADLALAAPVWLGVPGFGPVLTGALVALSVGIVAVLVFFTRAVLTAAGAVFLPALTGVAAAGVIDPGLPFAARIWWPLACCVAFGVAAVVWLWRRAGTTLAALGFWGMLVLATSGAAALGWGLDVSAPLLLGVSVLTISAIPQFAVRVPEAQLIDLPLLTTFAPAVRTPQVSAPVRITMRRVRSTMAEAQGVMDALVLGAVALAVAMTPAAARKAGTTSLDGWATLALLACTLLSLCFVSPTTSRLGRLAPRVGAVVVAAVAATTLLSIGLLPPLAGAGGLAGLAAVLWFASVIKVRETDVALLGHIADILRGLGLALVLPAGVLAAGILEIAWKAGS